MEYKKVNHIELECKVMTGGGQGGVVAEVTWEEAGQ